MESKHDSLQAKIFSTYSLSVLNMGSKNDSRQPIKFVYWCWTYSLCALKLQSCQLKKCFYWRSTYRLSVLNTGWKHNKWDPKKFLYCAAATVYVCSIRSRNMTRANRKFLYWFSTYRLSVLNMVSKHDPAKRINSYIGVRPTNYLWRIWARNKSRANRRNFSIDVRPTAYLCLIWDGNTTRVIRINSCIGARPTAYLCWIRSRNMTHAKRKFVYWRSTYRLSVLNMVSKHDFRQTKKFIYWLSTYSLSVKNNGLITWLAPTEEIPVLPLDLHPVCVEYGFQTWLAPTEKIRVLALDLHPNCAEYSLETWLSRTEENRVLALDLQPLCADYRLETTLATT